MHEPSPLLVAGREGGPDRRSLLADARERHRRLLAAGVRFPGVPEGTLPWLMALEPFTLGPELTMEVQRLGQAVFAFIDAVQDLYVAGDATVRSHLDAGVPPDLRGLEPSRRIRTFRLDIVLARGRPVVTEIEEVYGNAGKAYAMQSAYGTCYRGLFDFFAGLRLSHVLVDDTVRTYGSELRLLQRALAEQHGQDVAVAYLSAVDPATVRAAWRFCYTVDLAQYPPGRRRALTRSGIRFVNPLFHGYGTKALLPLAWHPDLTRGLSGRLGDHGLARLRAGLPPSRLIGPGPDVRHLAGQRRGLVAKVVSSPDDRSATWGSRGVYFGESSARTWARVLAAAEAGHLPGRPDCAAGFLVMPLIESDRFAVPFLHPGLDRIDVMPRARIRVSPILVRDGGSDPGRIVAGHATFVATSRKVHLGRHAVCAPLDWARPTGDPPPVPGRHRP